MPASWDVGARSGLAGGVPVWSVMIPTYRPTLFLKETLTSVMNALLQVEGSIQIEIVDDATPDVDVFELIKAWGFADKVGFFRRDVNGGLGRCWNTCIDRAAGVFVHILHQDDLIKPTFYARLEAAAESWPSADMFFCRTEFKEASGCRVDALEQVNEGPIDDWLKKISQGQRLQCPSVVVRRELYQRISRFDDELRYVVDWVMWVRIASVADVVYVPEALAVYRIHGDAETQRVKAAGITTRDFSRGLRLIRIILKKAKKEEFFAGAAQYAIQASEYAVYEAKSSGNMRAAAKEVATALRCLGRFMGLSQLMSRIKSYLRFRIKSLMA